MKILQVVLIVFLVVTWSTSAFSSVYGQGILQELDSEGMNVKDVEDQEELEEEETVRISMAIFDERGRILRKVAEGQTLDSGPKKLFLGIEQELLILLTPQSTLTVQRSRKEINRGTTIVLAVKQGTCRLRQMQQAGLGVTVVAGKTHVKMYGSDMLMIVKDDGLECLVRHGSAEYSQPSAEQGRYLMPYEKLLVSGEGEEIVLERGSFVKEDRVWPAFHFEKVDQGRSDEIETEDADAGNGRGA